MSCGSAKVAGWRRRPEPTAGRKIRANSPSLNRARLDFKGSVMNRGLRIGRLFGINIHIDGSWIFIFLLVTWSLASGLLPSWHPEWSAGLRWGVAIAASLLFFVSILLHELSHSLVARAQGLPVRRI